MCLCVNSLAYSLGEYFLPLLVLVFLPLISIMCSIFLVEIPFNLSSGYFLFFSLFFPPCSFCLCAFIVSTWEVSYMKVLLWGLVLFYLIYLFFWDLYGCFLLSLEASMVYDPILHMTSDDYILLANMWTDTGQISNQSFFSGLDSYINFLLSTQLVEISRCSVWNLVA